METPLKRERIRREIRVIDLANAMGVQQPTINRIENGKKRPSPELAIKLADYFGNVVTRDQILFPEFHVEAVRSSASRPGVSRKARTSASRAA